MTYHPNPEHEEFYRQELNFLEKLSSGISSTDDFLRLTNIILARQTRLLEVLTGQTGGGGGGTTTFPKLDIRTDQLIQPYSARSIEIINPAKMSNCLAANRVLVIINNTLNQAVRVYIIGNNSDSFSPAFAIKEHLCPAGQARAYGLKKEEWMPWVGVQLQAWVAPTAGSVYAQTIIQE